MSSKQQHPVAKSKLAKNWVISFVACAAGLLGLRLVLGADLMSPAVVLIPALIATIFTVGQATQKK